MASVSSSSLSTIAIPVCSSSIISSRPQVSFSCSNPSKFMSSKPSRITSSRVMAAPDVLESSADASATEDEVPSASALSVGAASDKIFHSLEVYMDSG